MIPNDWSVERMSSLISAPIQNGVFNDPARKGKGCKLINVGDLYNAVPVPSQLLERFDASKDELSRFGVARGDIFFTRSSLTPDGIAHCNVYDCSHHEEVVFDCHIVRVRANKKKIEPFYLFRYCKSYSARKYLVTNAKTTTMTTIDQAVIANLPTVVPPLAEQRDIATALHDVDILISSLDQLIAKKRDIRQATMQQLLTGKQRLPGFGRGSVKFKQTSVGLVPEEWDIKPLGDLGSWKGGMTPSMKNRLFWANGDIPWASSADVKATLLVDTQMKVTNVAIKQSATTLLPPNSILIVTRSGILRRYLPVAKNTKPMAINQDIKALIPNDDIHADFILHVLIGCGHSILSACLKSGTTVESIEYPWLKAYQIPVPPVSEQIAISTALSDMDAELAALEQKRDKTKALKQGMMQELLTGRIRLV